MDCKAELEMFKNNFLMKLKDSKLNIYQILLIMDCIPEEFDFMLKEFDTFMLSLGKSDGSELDTSNITEEEYFKLYKEYVQLRIKIQFYENKKK